MTEQHSLVSIVIPCYSHAQFVQDTIQSVIDQDYENIELIIIDDGSKDNSVEVIQQMIPACEERFVRFEFRYRPNKGLCATLNEALEWCEGEFFAPVASDDILMSKKISIQINYMNNNPNCIGVFGAIQLIDNNKLLRTITKKPDKFNFRNIFLHEHFLPAPTQLLRLDSVKSIGGYREDLIIEDWSMWLSLTHDGGTLDLLEDVFAKYRRHDGNLSSQFDKMKQGRIEIVKLYPDSKLYNKALSKTFLINADENIGFDYLNSISSLFYSIKIYPLVIFSISFYKYFAKLIISKKVYD